MDLDRPDSHFYDDPSYWAPGLSAPVRDDNRKLIAESINNNPYVKLIHETMAFATARMVEDWLLKEADHQYDYQKRINDYIQKIPNTPDLLQGALVDLSSQMGHYLDKSQLFSDTKTVNTKDLSEEQLREAFNLHLWQLLEVASRIERPLRVKLLASVAQPLTQILPPQEQQQPQAGPLFNDRPNLSLQQPQADILSIGMPTLSPQQPQAGTLSPQEQQHPHPLSFGSPTLSLQQPRAGILPVGSHLQQPRAGNLSIGSPTLSPQEQPQEQQQPLAGTLSIDSPTLSPEQQQLLSTDTIATHQFFR
ncbi:uncharacterized protein LOC144557563 [Carex rostrata]